MSDYAVGITIVIIALWAIAAAVLVVTVRDETERRRQGRAYLREAWTMAHKAAENCEGPTLAERRLY